MAKLLRQNKAWEKVQIVRARLEILNAIERMAIGISTTKDCEAIEHLSQAYCNLSGLHFLRGPKGEAGLPGEQGPRGENGAEYVAKLRGPTIPGVQR